MSEVDDDDLMEFLDNVQEKERDSDDFIADDIFFDDAFPPNESNIANELRNEIDRLKDEIENYRKKCQTLDQKYSIKDGEIKIVRDNYNKLQNRNNELTSQLAKQYENYDLLKRNSALDAKKEVERLKNELKFKDQELLGLQFTSNKRKKCETVSSTRQSETQKQIPDKVHKSVNACDDRLKFITFLLHCDRMQLNTAERNLASKWIFDPCFASNSLPDHTKFPALFITMIRIGLSLFPQNVLVSKNETALISIIMNLKSLALVHSSLVTLIHFYSQSCPTTFSSDIKNFFGTNAFFNSVIASDKPDLSLCNSVISFLVILLHDSQYLSIITNPDDNLCHSIAALLNSKDLLLNRRIVFFFLVLSHKNLFFLLSIPNTLTLILEYFQEISDPQALDPVTIHYLVCLFCNIFSDIHASNLTHLYHLENFVILLFTRLIWRFEQVLDAKTKDLIQNYMESV